MKFTDFSDLLKSNKYQIDENIKREVKQKLNKFENTEQLGSLDIDITGKK